MANEVPFIHRWTVHLSRPENEWEALCGDPNPELLVEDTKSLLPGYQVCPKCLELRPKTV